LHHPRLLRNTIFKNADRFIDGKHPVHYFLQRVDIPQAVKLQITQESSDQLPPPQNTTVLFQVLLQSKGFNVDIIEVVTPSSHKMWIWDTVKQNTQTFKQQSSTREFLHRP
jgi:hypothetical protein